MSLKKYEIIIDTNGLGDYDNGHLKTDNLKFLSINKAVYKGLISFLQDNALKEQFKIVVPKIVFEELKQQQIEIYNGQLNKLEDTFSKFKVFPEFQMIVPSFDYNSHLETKIEVFTDKYEIDVIDYPPDSCLKKIIKRSINKEKPFYKKGKDSGFKDTIIWESIIAHAKNTPNTIFMFFSKDKDFDDENLKKEFSKETGAKLMIFDSLANLKIEIDKLNSLKLDFERIRTEYEQTFFPKIIRILRSGQLDYVEWMGPEKEESPYQTGYPAQIFSRDNKIIDINHIENNQYEIACTVTICHDTQYTEWAQVVKEYAPYAEEITTEKISVRIEKKDNAYKIKTIVLDDLRFNGKNIIEFD